MYQGFTAQLGYFETAFAGKATLICTVRAARLSASLSVSGPCNDMHRKLSWLPVKVKLHLRLLVYLYKVFKYHTPCFFFEKLVYVGLRHDYKHVK